MELNRIELYRLLLAEELDLLDDAGKERLRAALRDHPEIDRAGFIEGARRALNEDDREMLQSLQSTQLPEGGRKPARRLSRTGRAVLIAAASVALLWFGGRALLPGDRGGPAEVVVLDAARAGRAAPRVDLDSGPERISLDTGERPAEASVWQLRDGAGVVLRAGLLEPVGPGDPVPPIQIEKAWLRPAQAYWVVLLDSREHVVAEWRFETR